MNKMLANQISIEEFIQTLKMVRSDIDDQFVDELHQLVKFYQCKTDINPIAYLMDRWTNSLETEPDYSVYADKRYLMEAWACWHIYSRVYISNIIKKMPLINESISLIDLGCGTALTTSYFKASFPDIRVIGTQLKDTDQWNVAAFHAEIHGFELVESTKNLGFVNIVFASEYFEHFERPLEHLEEVVADLNPYMLITANSFNTVGLGHFKTYKHGNELIHQKDISKRFNKKLRELGYGRFQDVKFWNNKPSVWAKDEY
jgi:hypothetical protein